MAIALGTSPAHPLYLYIVFVVCVVGALVLLITGWLSQRRSSWPRYWQTQSPDRDAKAYPVEPSAPTTVAVPEPAASVASVPAKKSPARKATATKPRPAAKKTTAKKTAPRKTSTR